MSDLNIVRRGQSSSDLKLISEYIAEDNIDAGFRFLIAAEEAIHQLTLHPELGRPQSFRAPRLRNLRSWRVSGFENYLIFYRYSPGVLEILRVIHGARDLRRALPGGE